MITVKNYDYTVLYFKKTHGIFPRTLPTYSVIDTRFALKPHYLSLRSNFLFTSELHTTGIHIDAVRMDFFVKYVFQIIVTALNLKRKTIFPNNNRDNIGPLLHLSFIR